MSEQKDIQFREKINSIYGDRAETVLTGLKSVLPQIFRVNTLKAKEPETLSRLNEEGFTIKKGPLDFSYINCSDKSLSESALFKNGLIYVQGLSSMLSVISLEPKENDKVLDLCASPGSKTSLIAQNSNNKACITAVENNRSRFFALKANLENLDVSNVELVMTDASFLDLKNPEMLEKFDKVLADVPCSNESLINLNNLSTIENWNPKLAKKLSKLQKRLLMVGAKMLKPDGILVYSTCTFSVEENEEVIDWLLKKDKNMEIIDLSFGISNMVDGLIHWKNKEFNLNLRKTKRVLPNGAFGAFYIAKLHKKS